ncbi:hypothetical protein O9993_06265 [Vibrio lentus]|nr:hypothetical protein [Vibrio lentus]
MYKRPDIVVGNTMSFFGDSLLSLLAATKPRSIKKSVSLRLATEYYPACKSHNQRHTLIDLII